jgi:hypothetical protein
MTNEAKAPPLIVIIESVEQCAKNLRDKDYMRKPAIGFSVGHTLHMAACALQERAYELMEAEHVKSN